MPAELTTHNQYFRWKYALLVSFIVLVITGCSEDVNQPIVTEQENDGRGRVVFAEQIGIQKAADIQSQFTEYEVPLTAEYDVALYRVLYQTVDASGNRIVASGAIAVPQGATTSALPLLSFQHSTVTSKSEVPSEQGFFLEATALGTSGYIAVFPDYIGLGVSQGVHPFLHAQTLASSVVDMIRAGKAFCKKQSIPWNGQLFLMGYSEGGYATLAAQRELEQKFSDEFTITGSAPMTGPYDLSGSILDLAIEGGEHPFPLFLPYLIYSYNRVYGMFDSLEQVFQQPYASTIPELFDGTKSTWEINEELPMDPRDMLTESFLNDFINDYNHPLRVRLRENDLYRNWKPISPTRLFHCKEDDLVPYQNSVTTLEEFRNMGAPDVELGTLLISDHRQCGQPALLLGKFWFDTLRK